ncbi:MAG: octanoyltransferase [Roseibacillus sp.]|nr:octanoyltransferase [Roseibacillus sp.]MDP6209221.1 lipoyl(octanoyl) transferase LipB [Roseibacillus sp.]MDP7497636.1 lipoyl(octanoyl) transferase LipB [Roseibacillus sp.]
MISRWLGTNVSYQDALQFQEEHVRQLQSGEAAETVFLLEHAPVYTIGRTRDQSSLGDTSHLPHPVFEINRGGQATCHGPGQLVGYPILDLHNYGKDLHAYLRLLEESLVTTLADFGVLARRREGLTGVWVEDRKIASIGVGVRKWITMHGFALNISPESLPPFLAITPCGIDGVTTTCLHHESSQQPDTQAVGKATLHHLSIKLAELAANSAP